jgi:hypothetical protein
MTTGCSPKDVDEAVMRAYKLAFGSPAGQAVLMDLVPFCRALETCIAADKGKPVDRDRTMVLLGRHEVFLRIQKFLNLSYEQLFQLQTGQSIATGEQ